MIIQTSSLHERTRRSLISDDDFQSFGSLIIRACLYNRDFFEQAVVVVDYDAVRDQYSKNDFIAGSGGDVNGLIFAGMLDFKHHHVKGNAWPTTPTQWLQAISPHLRDKFAKNPDWPEQILRDAFAALLSKYPPTGMGEMDLVCDGLVDYVRGVRLRAATIECRNADPVTKQKVLDDVKTTIRIPGQESTLFTVEDHVVDILNFNAQRHSFRTGVRQFDQFYGDYAAPGDAWLAAGLPGAGKTVWSCQVAGATAAFGRKVLLVTTEVSPAMCILRACSSSMGISFDALKSLRGSGSLDSSDSGLQFKDWVNTTGRNLFVVDYDKMPGDTYENRMEAILNKFEKVHGQMPELVLFDWIGKAANHDFADSWQKREHYNRIANHNSLLADRLSIVTWTLAQADNSIRGKIDIGESATGESKALAQPMEGVLFFTSLMENHQGGDQMEDAYQQRQWLVIPKCRDRPTKKIPVMRRFEMQRFEDAH